MRPTRLIRVVLLGSAALGALSTPAHAQLGKLKKLGSDAIKEAAKAKAGLPEPGTDGGSAQKRTTPITAERLELVLASLEPLVEVAEAQTKAAAASRDYNTRQKAAQACMERVEKAVNPAAMTAMDEKRMARLDALQKQGDGINARLKTAMARNDAKASIALRDSMQVLSMISGVIAMGGSCEFPHLPPEMIALQAASEAQQRQGGAFAARSDRVEPTPAAKKAMTRGEFGLLRERIALWAIAQSDPALQKGIEGKFTPEELAALAAKGPSISRLAPLFKSGALRWAEWSDVSDW